VQDANRSRLEMPPPTSTMIPMTTKSGADVRLEDEAAVVLFQPLTPAAHAWFKENVPTEEWQWVGGRLRSNAGMPTT
jgi:hypothetical protein